jgi:hypothetical protein
MKARNMKRSILSVKANEREREIEKKAREANQYRERERSYSRKKQ